MVVWADGDLQVQQALLVQSLHQVHISVLQLKPTRHGRPGAQRQLFFRQVSVLHLACRYTLSMHQEMLA